jgi:PleD family two-component response regulator
MVSKPTHFTEPEPKDYNILIVDDTPVNLGVVVDFLQQGGFGIRIARSGESALSRVQYDKPDVVLLDVLMPGRDGFETCRRLKQNEATKDIPVIFMTSLTGTEDKVKGFETGAVDYVTKPLHQEEVLMRLKTHVRLRDLTLNLQEKNKQLETSSRSFFQYSVDPNFGCRETSEVFTRASLGKIASIIKHFDRQKSLLRLPKSESWIY